MAGYLDSASNITFGWSVNDDSWGVPTNRSLRQLAYIGSQTTVKNITTSAPPSSPMIGDKYIVAASPTGAWAAYNQGDVAVWGRSLATPATVRWQRFQPMKGWRFYNEDTDQMVRYNGTAWIAPAAVVPAEKPI